MLSLIPSRQVDLNPNQLKGITSLHMCIDLLVQHHLKEGANGANANDWYCAQMIKVLPTHVLIHYYTATIPPVNEYATTGYKERENQVSQAVFLKTWCLLGGRGYATTEPPKGISKTRDIWSGKMKVSDLQDHLLVRNVELDGSGQLSQSTVLLASKLKYPHHHH
jgi:hypothetical protein